MSKPELFINTEFDEADHKLQNCIRVTTHIEDFETEVYTGVRWVPVGEYVRGLVAFIQKGGNI